MKLTKNFTLEELCKSSVAEVRKISNVPSTSVIKNLETLCKMVLQPIRDRYGYPITVTSGYRCSKLNKAVGGSDTSQHLYGQAADIKCTKTKNRVLFEIIKGMINRGEIKVGQLIWEYGDKNEPSWIHISTPGGHINQIKYIGVKQ